MKAPKIVVQWVGYAADGEGFYQIPHAPIKSTTDHKTAKITVEGVHLSACCRNMNCCGQSLLVE